MNHSYPQPHQGHRRAAIQLIQNLPSDQLQSYADELRVKFDHIQMMMPPPHSFLYTKMMYELASAELERRKTMN